MNKKRLLLIVTILFSVFYLVGLFGHLFPETRTLMLEMTPYFLVIFGIIAVLPVILEKNKGVLFWGTGTMVITFFLESLGTKTGLVFGPYTYGKTLGFHLLGVPPVIAFNWLLVVIAAVIFSKLLTRNPILAALFTGGFAVLFDFIMEPIAITYSYWYWHGADIPVQNYIAWFLIAFTAALVFGLLKLKVSTKIPMVYVLIQFIFFISLRFTI